MFTSRCTSRCPKGRGDSIEPKWHNVWANKCTHAWCYRSGVICGADLTGCLTYESVPDFYKCCNANDKSCNYDSSDAKRRAADTPKACGEASNAIWFNFVADTQAQRECGVHTFVHLDYSKVGFRYKKHRCAIQIKNNTNWFYWSKRDKQYYCEKGQPGCDAGGNIAYYI